MGRVAPSAKSHTRITDVSKSGMDEDDVAISPTGARMGIRVTTTVTAAAAGSISEISEAVSGQESIDELADRQPQEGHHAP